MATESIYHLILSNLRILLETKQFFKLHLLNICTMLAQGTEETKSISQISWWG